MNMCFTLRRNAHSASVFLILFLLGCLPSGLDQPRAAATLSAAQVQATGVRNLENAQQARSSQTVARQTAQVQETLTEKQLRFQETQRAVTAQAQSTAHVQQRETAEASQLVLIQGKETLQRAQSIETSVAMSITIANANLLIAQKQREIEKLAEDRERAELENRQRALEAEIRVTQASEKARQENLSLQIQAEQGRQSEWWRSLMVNVLFGVLPVAVVVGVGYLLFRGLFFAEVFVKGKYQAQTMVDQPLPLLPAGYVIVPEEAVMTPEMLLMTAGSAVPEVQEISEGEIVEGDEVADPLTPGRQLILTPETPIGRLPMGTSPTYPEGWWPTLQELDSILIAGTRRMGKTNLVKCIIEALIWQRSSRLILADGKGGVEFGQYLDCPRCQVLLDDVRPSLEILYKDLNRRFEALRNTGTTNIDEYNAQAGVSAKLTRIIIVIDELMYILQEDGVEEMLVDLVARGGAFGIHPILATQHPSRDVITPKLKANLSTRIALPVPQISDSQVILGRTGAEKLEKVPGRYLVVHNAQLMEVQSYVAPPHGTWKKTPQPSLEKEEELTPEVIEEFDLENEAEAGERGDIQNQSPLTEVEKVLVEAALLNEGRFVLNVVKEAAVAKSLQISRRKIAELALKWEEQQLLFREPRQTSGGAGSRLVSDELIDLFVQSGGKMPTLS